VKPYNYKIINVQIFNSSTFSVSYHNKHSSQAHWPHQSGYCPKLWFEIRISYIGLEQFQIFTSKDNLMKDSQYVKGASVDVDYQANTEAV
jgi:hypothetical protein